jgi:hypothetical protein
VAQGDNVRGSAGLDDKRRAVLTTLADTFVPAVRPPDAERDDPHGYWRRTAADVGVGPLLADRLEELLGPTTSPSSASCSTCCGSPASPGSPRAPASGCSTR